MAVITTEAAQGAISAHRATRRPGNFWLKSWESASEMSMVPTTTVPTQMPVRMRMPGRSGSSHRYTKFRQPAQPRMNPSGLMCWKAVWIMMTTGQSTTTTMRAVAGPIQTSGSSLAASLSGGRRVRASALSSPAAETLMRLQLPFRAVSWMLSSTGFGLGPMAVPMICWICTFTCAQTGSFGY